MKNKMVPKPLKDKACLVIATLFGVGHTPLMPGTAACLVALGVFFVIKDFTVFVSLTLITVVMSFPISSYAEKIYKVKDCKKIVIDDFSGMLVALLAIPKKIEFVIPAFFLFRAFDMLKVPPADKIEKKKGGIGIVGDDLIAGAYTFIIFQLVKLALNTFS